jgi:hypothetical protein
MRALDQISAAYLGAQVTLNDVMVAVLAECMHKAKDAVRADASRSLPGRALDGVLPDRVACFIPMSFRRPHDATAKNRSLGGMVYIPRPPSLGVSGRSKRDIYEAIHRAKFQLSLIKRRCAHPGDHRTETHATAQSHASSPRRLDCRPARQPAAPLPVADGEPADLLPPIDHDTHNEHRPLQPALRPDQCARLQ